MIVLEKTDETSVICVSQCNGIKLKLIEDAHAFREDCHICFSSLLIATQLLELVGHCSLQVLLTDIIWGCVHEFAKKIKLYIEINIVVK